jgi:hypothetical protein
MMQNNEIEEFSGGGRISPSMSATYPPKGTLNVGLNGNVWINAEDKNGRLAWKQTDITKGNLRLLSFSYISEDSFEFYHYKNSFLFKFYYNYDKDSCKILISTAYKYNEFKSDLNGCNDWFEDNFDIKEYNSETLTEDGIVFKAIVRKLFGILKNLITNKGLRSITASKPDEAPEPKFKYGDKVIRKGGKQIMTVVKQIYDDKKQEWDYDLVFENGNPTILFESLLEASPEKNPEPKFKVGDKVKRIDGEQVMTVVKQIYDTTEKEWDYDLVFDKDGNPNSLFESYLELYEEAPETKKTPFQQIDFLNPSTEENDVLIKTMSYYSDGLTFVNSNLAGLKFKLKDRIGSVEVLFDKVNNIIKISEPSKNINVSSLAIQQKITNENITEITNLYFATLEKFIEIAESEIPSKDCEADPNKIISGQVKKFYDLNKSRIDKLDSKFSCKIVQALVSLSEYESCGSPSSSSQQPSKNELLSRISKLKI